MRSTFLFLLATTAFAACTGTETTPAASNIPTTTDTTLEPDASTAEPPIEQPDAAPKPDAASKGCSLAPQGAGTFAKRTTTAGGKARAYHLAVPAGAKTKQALPLVFVLHGAGDTSPQNMRDWFAVESRMASTLAVYPQALPRTRSDGTGGNIPRWDLSGNDDLAFFDAVLGELSDAYCVDRAHVFVTGFSSGGNFSQHLACLRQHDVKGMAVVAGPGPFSDACDGAVPTWMTHDVNDDALPVSDARSSRDFWGDQNGCTKNTWSPLAGAPGCKTNTSCPATAPLVYCETTGVGHAVPELAVGQIGDFFGGLLKLK